MVGRFNMVKLSKFGTVYSIVAAVVARSSNTWTDGTVGNGPIKVGKPEHVGVDGSKLGQVEQWMPGYLSSEYFPGAQVTYLRSGQIIKNNAYGYSYLYTDGNYTRAADPIMATTDTIWDLASMSKLFTTTLAMTLYEKGYFQMDDTVASHIPEFATNGKSSVTIRMLLVHTSGFPPDYNMWELGPDRATRLNNTLLGALQNPPGEVYLYSDVNLIIIGILIERWTGMRQDEYFEKAITGPLGLKDTMYNPLNRSVALKSRIAATEFQGPPTNRGLVWGEVHDENTWYLDGVAGHAGVFSTAQDLAVFFEMHLRGGSYDGVRILKQSTVDMMRVDYNWAFPGDHHGLGFEIDQQWYMDAFSSEQTLGHTGYTGTYAIMDFRNQIISLLLTNRVHPVRTGPSTNPPRRSTSRTLASGIPLAIPSQLMPAYFSDFGNLLNRSLVVALPKNASTLKYSTWYNTEPNFDFGYVEISSDNMTWTLSKSYTNHSTGWIDENLSLPQGAKTVRFRYSTDASANGRGWYVGGLTGMDPSDITLGGWIACNGFSC